MKPVFFKQPARLLLTLLFPIFFFQMTYAAVVKSKQSGAWTAASTWEGGAVPTDNDDVVIKIGHTVTRSNAFVSHGYLYVYGTMVYTGNVAREYYVGTNIEIDGVLRVEGGSLFAGGIVYGDGLFKQTAGNTTFFKAVVMKYTEILGGTMYYQNINNGNLYLENLTLKGAEITVDGTEDLHVQNSMSWQHNGKFGGDLRIDNGATLTFSPGNFKFYHHGFLWNDGTVVMGTGTFTRYNSPSDVRNYGLWEFKVQANAGAYASNIYFSNYGEVLNTGPGSASISKYQGHAGSNLHMQQSGMTIYPTIDIQYGNWQIDAACSILVFAPNAGEYIKFGGAKIVNNGGFYGRIAFAGSNETVLEGNGHYEHVEIAKTSDVVSLAGSPEVKQAFTLTSGRIVLNQYDLRLGSANLDFSNGLSSYIETNGTGACVLNCPVGEFALYPIGNSEFAPFAIQLNQGSTSDLIKVRVSDSFYGEYTGNNPACSEEIPVGVVRQNWFVSEQIPGGSLATLVAYWNVGAERDGFDRANCTLGQYINSNWQNNGFRPAVDVSSLHGFFGFNFTSFGIFGVYDAGHEGDVNFVTPAPDGNTPICEWKDLQLHANTSPNAQTQWSGPNGFQSNEHNPSIPGVQLSQGGVYNIVASQYGCPEKQASVTVQVNAEPTASVLGPDHIQPGESATLTAYGGTSYLWSTGESTQAIIVAPTQITDYVVTVTNAAGCTATVLHTVQVSGASATQEAAETLGQVQLTPNPASDATMLSFESTSAGEAQLLITDTRGAQLSRQNAAVVSGQNQINLSLVGIAAGTYQVTLIRDREVKTIRVVKMMNE